MSYSSSYSGISLVVSIHKTKFINKQYLCKKMVWCKRQSLEICFIQKIFIPNKKTKKKYIN